MPRSARFFGRFPTARSSTSVTVSRPSGTGSTTGGAVWFSVDLPEIIAFREQLLPPDPRFRHLPGSALSADWLTALDPDRPCFITAQGLLMYLPEKEVRTLLQTIAARLPGAWMMFDAVPWWLVQWSRLRMPISLRYVPPAPSSGRSAKTGRAPCGSGCRRSRHYRWSSTPRPDGRRGQC